MTQRQSLTHQWGIVTKRIVICYGCVGLPFLVIGWFGLRYRLQATENILSHREVHVAPTNIPPKLVANYRKPPLSFEANFG